MSLERAKILRKILVQVFAKQLGAIVAHMGHDRRLR